MVPTTRQHTKLCFGAACVIIVAIIMTVEAKDSCRELCCSAENKTLWYNFTTTRMKTDNMSNCLQKCRGRSGFTNISVHHLCGRQNTTFINKLPLSNGTVIKAELLNCSEMYNVANSDFIGVVRGIQVNFYKVTDYKTYYYVNVTWSPFIANDTSKNWTHYVITWLSEGMKLGHHRCDLVPKDQTFFLINSSKLWQYPWDIQLNISTYPLKKGAGYRLGFYARPKINLPFRKSPFSEASASVSMGLLAAIIVGVIIGFALFVSLACAWKLNVRVHTSRNIFLKYFESLGRNEKKNVTKKISEMTIVEDTTQVYISYFYEDDKYLETVVAVLRDLSALGYNIKFNMADSRELVEEGPNRWAQTQITSSSKIIVMCSQSYIKICQQGAAAICDRSSCEWNRVWFETQMIGNIYSERKSASKIVCVWMNNGVPEGIPPWMGVRYTWPQDLEQIVQRLKKNSRGSRGSNRESRTSRSCIQFSNDVKIDDEDGEDGDDNVFTEN